MILPIHIVAGALAIVLGTVALSVKKGGTIHRRSGMLFVFAMVVMGTTAALLEFLEKPSVANVTPAVMTLYFVGTALTTVRPATRWTRVIDAASLTVACALALLLTAGGVKGVSTAGLAPGGVSFRTIGVMAFILAASFFSIRERVATILPEPFTTGPMRALPIVLLFGVMFHWLWRVRGRRALPA